MNTHAALETLGLSDKEAAVYLAGLELGVASVKALAVKTKIKRTTIYQVLEDLKSKRLFTETIQGKKRRFVAAHPNELKAIENDRCAALDANFAELEALATVSPGQTQVQYYDSLEGIHHMYEEALKGATKETLGIADVATAEQLGKEWLQAYIEKRKRKGLTARTVLVGEAGAKQWLPRDEADHRNTRFLPADTELPVNLEVVGDTVLITSLESETLGLSITSQKVATAMRTLLDISWEAGEGK